MIYQDSGIDEFGLYCSKSANGEAVTLALDSATREAIEHDQGEYRRLAGMVDAGAQSEAFSAALEAYIHERVGVENAPPPEPLSAPEIP